MRKKEEKNSIIEICPVRNAVARFGNKQVGVTGHSCAKGN